MNIPFFNLDRQYKLLSTELEPVVSECMASCSYVNGKYVSEFETAMASYLGVKHVIGVANGTDALMIALRACGVSAGDEVITTPFTFFATAEAIAAIGAKPVFVDVLANSFNLDPNQLEQALTPRTKAIMPVHIFGQPVELDSIYAFASQHGLKVIEDSAQAIGAEYKGSKIGNTADLACFSFYPTKNLGAFGDAGMITTNDDDLHTIACAFKEHGAAQIGARARELLEGVKDDIEGNKQGDTLYNPYKYYNYLIGYNSRLDAIQAAILQKKLKHLDTFNNRRATIAQRYTDTLGSKVLTPPVASHMKSCWHQYAIRVCDKGGMIEYLNAQGIGCGDFYPVPIHLQKAFTYLGYAPGSMPVAEKLCSETVCLPIFPELRDEELDYIINAVLRYEEQ